MVGVVREGNDDTIQGGIETFDLAHAPALVLAIVAGVEGEQGVRAGKADGQLSGRVVEGGGGEDGIEPWIGFVDFAVCREDFRAEWFVEGLGLGLNLEGVKPFVVFAVGFEFGRQQAGQLGGLFGLTGVGEFFDEQEQEVRLIVELFGQIEPEGFGFGKLALGEEVLEGLMVLGFDRHLW